MATYEDSYVDVRKALDTLADNIRDARMSRSLRRVRGRINDGESMFEAFRREGDRYPELFLRMTKVGEESGTLAQVYSQLANYFGERVAMRRRFIMRLIYPSLMLSVAILVHSVLSAVFNTISMEASALDWNEMERVFVRTFLRDVGIVAALVAGIYLIRLLFWGRTAIDAFLFFLPGIGRPFRKGVLGRFSFSMALMTGSAIPMPEAVRESGKATDNGYAAWQLDRAASQIEEGTELTPALDETNLFPREFMDVMETAEESGKIAESLQHVAPRYTEEADDSMNALLAGLAWAIYLGVVAFMAYYIITLYARYIGMVMGAMGGMGAAGGY